MNAPTKPRCAGCLHYFITYDPDFPYGCRAMNFKSRAPPHREVEEATGTHCQMFTPRPTATPRPPPHHAT